jgi:hypothetical protein
MCTEKRREKCPSFSALASAKPHFLGQIAKGFVNDFWAHISHFPFRPIFFGASDLASDIRNHHRKAACWKAETTF